MPDLTTEKLDELERLLADYNRPKGSYLAQIETGILIRRELLRNAPALIAAARKGLAMEWRDIDMAPKDGSDILICNVFGAATGYGPQVGWYSPASSAWFNTFGGKSVFRPSHWMPLPKAPTPPGDQP